MEREFARDFQSLDDIFAFVGEFLSQHDIDESVAYSINLAVEELFTNMVKYNLGTDAAISIRISTDNRCLTLQLVDSDVDAFDPSSSAEVVVDEPAKDRNIGGLGLHLVKTVVDKIIYEYEDRVMTVTVTKNLEPKHV